MGLPITGCARIVAGVKGVEGCKKAAREETTGPQEMEELPWGPEAVRPYQVYLVTPGLGGLFWRQPFTTTRLRSRRLHADTQMGEAAQQSVALSRPLSGLPELGRCRNSTYILG